MRLTLALATSVVCLALAPVPILASSCAEQIGTIERRLDSGGAIQVAGLQTGRAISLGSPRGVSAAHVDAPSDATMIPTAARIMDARGLIARAIDEDRQGAQRACEDTMTEAKGMIGALP